VARHARASRVELEVVVDPDLLTLVVADDGVGLPRTDERADGRGLRNARHRARAWGGHLLLEQNHPHGLVLRWRVPLVPAGVA
jgi:signal transduction histidine kinase